MNVYDFDETIYSGDSTRDFYFYSIKKDITLLRFLPRQGWAFAKYLFGLISKTQFKEKFYTFLSGIKDIDKEVEFFWQKHIKNIKKWYYDNKKADDVVISASPEFLLRPVADKLGFRLIASRVDKKSGKTEGENCYGEEKVRRLHEEIPDAQIEEFYSDSLSDTPLAVLSEKAYIVRENNLILWDEYKPSRLSRVLKMFIAKDFLAFMCVGILNVFNGVLFETLFSLVIDNISFSFTCGYALSLFIGYLLNSRFVFHDKRTLTGFLKFVVSYIPNYIVQSICVMFFGNVMHLPNLLVYIAAAAIGVPVTFALLKIFAFNKKDK